jgi:GR25 family glycosyltransferase involved in LPS biosynthesis
MKVRGFVLNLASAAQRRDRITSHLAQMALPGRYDIIEARLGNSDKQHRGQLSVGEDGLWQSCLALLEQALAENLAVDYIHILEDDCILSTQFCAWAHRIVADKMPPHALLFTDMFVEATLFAQLQPHAAAAFAEQRVQVMPGVHYSGCTASWLIPLAMLQPLLAHLREAYQRPGHEKLPLDIQLRDSIHARALDAGVTFPFLTSIDLNDQASSSIQNQKQASVAATNHFNAMLRKRLSYCRDDSDFTDLGPTLCQILNPSSKTIKQEESSRLNNDQWLKQLALELDEKRMFRYSFDQRLLHQPGNPQAEALG